jgi:hypothetical protein
MPSDTRLPASRVPILTDDQTRTVTREWFRFFEGLSALLGLGSGRFYDTTSPSFTADTSTIIPLGSTTVGRNMTLAANRVTLNNAGAYTVTVTLQLANADVANADYFILWLKVNGVDQAGSSSRALVPLSGYATLTATFQIDVAAGAYFELYGLSKAGYAQIATIAASGSPAYPAAPGVVLTVTQIL